MKLTISGKSVRFEANALFPVKYKKEFQRDIFKDLKYIESMQNINASNFEQFDMDVLYNIVWTLAWFGDRTIPERDEWLLSFNEFNVYEVLPQVIDLLTESLATTKKKTPPQQGKHQKPYHSKNSRRNYT